jgi:transposase-like protein
MRNVVEVVTRVQKRKRFTEAERETIVMESYDPASGSIVRVAEKHNIAPSALYAWRKRLRVTDPPPANLVSCGPKFVELSFPKNDPVDKVESSIFLHIGGEFVLEFGSHVSCNTILQFIAKLRGGTNALT